MSIFKGKTVAVIGPSKQALGKMDASVLANFDLVCRTNQFFEVTEKRDEFESRCDVLCLNKWTTERYTSKHHRDPRIRNVKSLLTKSGKADAKKLRKIYRTPCISLQKTARWIKKHKVMNSKLGKERKTKKVVTYIPYLMTTLILYILMKGGDVTVFGIDFYYNGFRKKENYQEGSFPVGMSQEFEEQKHSIRRELRFWHSVFVPDVNFHMSKEVENYFQLSTKLYSL